jgi:HlyD family secretion protein
MNKKIIVAAAVVLAALVGAGAWLYVRDSSPKDDGRITVEGNVDIRQVSLAFNASERIAELLVREGDRVTAGQVLGRLDVRTTKVKLAQADAQVASAGQALARLRAGSRPEEIAQARANVAAAGADAEVATTQVRRLQEVRDATTGKGISERDLDDARGREKVALSKLQAARQAAQLVVIGPRREDIAQAQSQLDAARAERGLLLRQLEESELKAPVDAVVRARLLEPGDIASPVRPAYTLAITRPKWVRAYLAERDLARVRAGTPATVTTDGAPGQSIAGTVGYISSVAEFTPKSVQTEELRTSLVYEIRVYVDDPNDTLRLGMPATVRIDTRAGAASAPPPKS